MNPCDSPGLMPVKQALDLMLSDVIQSLDTEFIGIIDAFDRVLVEDVFSPISVPPADNSAMDGYAFNSADLNSSGKFTIVGKSMAGAPFKGRVGKGQCVRIMTGAVIPDGADAVIMQEQVIADESHITVEKRIEAGNNIRRAGEDIAQGSKILHAGTKLMPAHLSLLASIGVGEVKVYRPINVALMATGDELTSPGSPLKEGAIYESNRYALYAMLKKQGCNVIDLGIVEDDQQALRDAFTQASQNADLVVTSGGVSVGDADYVKQILTESGQVGFWKVAIKPGKPFAFGKIGNALFCGLPGNPVSSYVTFQQLVMPLLHKMSGQSPTLPFVLKATTTAKIRKRPGRADFQRGLFEISDNGEILVAAHGRQGSGVMSSISNANCYILLRQDDSDLEEGSEVSIQPFFSIFQ